MPPVATIPIPVRCAAQIVALTVVAPSDPDATATGTSRRATLIAAPGSANRSSSDRSSPTRTAPSSTPIQPGIASASRIAVSIRSTHSRLRGYGRP